MNSRKSTRQRRGTILLIVVSLLALLFVIITGFLTVARNDRLTLLDMQRGDLTQSIIDKERDKILTAIEASIRSDNGRFLAGPGAEFAEMPQNKGVYIQSEPISSYSQNLNPPAGNYLDYQTDFANLPGSGWNAQEWEAFKRFWYANMSKLSAVKGDKPTAAAVWQLFIENHRDTGLAEGRIDYRDIENASREPFMDANGDGIPDSYFAFLMSSNEEANAMAGTPVQLTGTNLNPSQVPAFSNGSNSAADAINNAFVRWRELPRYDVAHTVKSNGAMVALDAPRIRDGQGNLVAPWNRLHTVRQFDDFRSPFDGINSPQRALTNFPPDARNYIFDQLAGEVSGVELALHRRGGLPSAPLTGGRSPTHAVPAILAALQGEASTSWQGFQNTFVPQFRLPPRGQAKRDNWERFNLQTPFVTNVGNERIAAVNAAQVSPHMFLVDQIQNGGSGNAVSLSSPSRSYNQRPYLTTISNSDEIARKMIPGDRIPLDSSVAANAGGQPDLSIRPEDLPTAPIVQNAQSAGLLSATDEGELKFPLQEIAKAIVEEPVGSGNYRWRRYDPANGGKLGDAIIERMARAYYDMLSQHDGWIPPPPPPAPLPPPPPPAPASITEILTRRAQAFQLAVNTAQFAMPRNPVNSTRPGFIDVVTYQDGVNGPKYIGYGPQPYISEVVAAFKADTSADPVTRTRLSVGVELFNPCDPHFAGAGPLLDPANFQGPAPSGQYDVFGLPVSQFAVSLQPFPPSDILNFHTFGTLLDGTNPTDPLPWPTMKWLNGRCFYKLVFDVPLPGNPQGNGVNDALVDNVAGDPTNRNHNLLQTPKRINTNIRIDTTFTVYLWKRGIGESSVNGSAGSDAWYLVDKLTIDISSLDSPFAPITQKHNWVSEHRDATPNRRFGAFDFATIGTNQDTYTPDGVPDTFARWNIVMRPDSGAVAQFAQAGAAPNNTLGNARFFGGPSSTFVRSPDDPANVSPGFQPTTPLVLMNAGPDGVNRNLPLYTRLNNLPMFGNQRTSAGNDPQVGDLRPRSFPTVGFLHFVPRYSHFEGPGNPPNSRVPASEYLLDHWEKHGNGGGSANPSYSVAGVGGLPGYPADFGHMPIFENYQAAVRGGVFDETASGGLGKVPWGLLVYDYFTTLDPATPGVDPLRVPGRTNINQAQWNVLSLAPVIGPALPNVSVSERYVANAAEYGLPIRGNWPTAIQTFPVPTRLGAADANCDPSPSFWDPRVGLLVGSGSNAATDIDPFNPAVSQPYPRLLMTDVFGSSTTREWGGPEFDPTTPTRWRLGDWLAISAAAYRDGVQNLGFDFDRPNSRRLFMRFADSHMRNPQDLARFRDLLRPSIGVNDPVTPGILGYRNCGGNGISGLYGGIRGSARATAATSGNPNAVDRPTQFGFTTIGELLNVKGWDSSRPTLLPPYPTVLPAALDDNPVLAQGDFVKAVSLLALTDTQVLTTRTNTFTAYVSVMDRENPEASLRAQFTIDRSNLLPRLSYDYDRPPPNANANWRGSVDKVKTMNILSGNFTYTGTDNLAETPVRWTAPAGLRPSIVAEKRIGYFNTRFDD